MFIQEFYDSRERLAKALAAQIAHALTEAIAARGEATLVVSGGSSPVQTFAYLRDADVDFSRVMILPSDERWVDESDELSNAAMIRRELLVGNAAAATYLSLYREGVSGADAAARISARVDALSRPFDYVLLGMGDDGHTASLFPDDPNIANMLKSRSSCVWAKPASQPTARISLSPSALLDSRAIGLLFFGQGKGAVFAAASSDGELSKLPVRCVLRQEIVPLTTYHAN